MARDLDTYDCPACGRPDGLTACWRDDWYGCECRGEHWQAEWLDGVLNGLTDALDRLDRGWHTKPENADLAARAGYYCPRASRRREGTERLSAHCVALMAEGASPADVAAALVSALSTLRRDHGMQVVEPTRLRLRSELHAQEGLRFSVQVDERIGLAPGERV